MLTMAVSILVGSPLGVVLGFFLWPFLLIFTIGPFLSRFCSPNPFSFWKKSTTYRVPMWVNTLAEQFGVEPADEMKVKPGYEIDAAVRGRTLYVTEGLLACRWTRTVEGVMAHELAHMAQQKSSNLLMIIAVLLPVLTVGFVGLIIGESWPIWVGAAFTIVPIAWPLWWRHQEYDADKRAAAVVGSDTMAHALEVSVDRSSWGEESDSHPSVAKRLLRLRKTRT